MATRSVTFPWLSNVITQRSAGAGVCYHLRWRWWRWLRLRVCDVFNVVEVGKRIQVFDWILVIFESTALSRFNVSGRAVNCQILCNLKEFRMVLINIFKSPAVWGELLSAWKFGATEWGLLWHCRRPGRSGVFTVERDETWSWAWAV